MIKKKKCLVLNSDHWTAIAVISWQRAMVLSVTEEKMEAVSVKTYYDGEYDFILSGNGLHFQMPAVVVKAEYVNPKNRRVPFSRKNVFLRDGMTCQYCGHFDRTCESLTYDHVVPRSKWINETMGTPTFWENIVTACSKCNQRKDNQTLKRSGFKLRRQPIAPNPFNFILGISPWTRIEPEWEQYLAKNPLYKRLARRDAEQSNP